MTAAIVMILAAILLPRLMQARVRAVETAAVGSTKNITTALAVFDTRYGVFPATLAPLGGLCNATTPPTVTAACLMDNSTVTALAGAVGQYNYTYVQTGSGSGFTLNADPAAGSAATLHLFVEEGLTIHTNATNPASATDPTL